MLHVALLHSLPCPPSPFPTLHPAPSAQHLQPMQKRREVAHVASLHRCDQLHPTLPSHPPSKASTLTVGLGLFAPSLH